MAHRSSAGARDWERWERQQAREAERQQRAAAAAAKAAERAEREQRIAARKEEAEQRTAEINQRVGQLETVLSAGLRHSARIEFASLKRRTPPPAFNPGALAVAEPEPAWEQFAPPLPG